MRKYVAFALMVCLFVLAIAIVLGMTNPGLRDSIGDCLRGLWQRVVDLGQHLVDHLIDLFSR